MRRVTLILAALFGAALAWGGPVLAAMQSANYAVPAATIAGGGGTASSASYQVRGAVGQSTPIGISLSTGYQLRAGFFFAVPRGGGVTVPIGALELLLLQPSP